MVYVTNRPYVYVRLRPLKFRFRHVNYPNKNARKNGALGVDRTRDLSLTKGVLYH